MHFDDETEFVVEEEFGGFVEVCSPDYEDGVEAILTIGPPSLEHTVTDQPTNCDNEGGFDWTVPSEPGFFQVTYLVTFPNGETCSGSQTLEAIE